MMGDASRRRVDGKDVNVIDTTNVGYIENLPEEVLC